MYGSLTIHSGTTQIEDRVTAPTPTGDANKGALAQAFWSLGVYDQWGEQQISHETALTYSAVWGCVRVISEALSGVGWHAFERKMDNQRFRIPLMDDIAWLLSLQANPETSAFDWRQVMLKDALTWGNAYAEIERTKSGRPLWLWQIHPSRVKVIRDGSQLLYEIENKPGTSKTYLQPESVFHLKGLSPDGIVGWSIVEMARKSIKLGLQEEAFGSDFFGRGIMPGGIVTIPGHVPIETRRQFRKDFESLYGGAKNQHRVVVMSDGLTFEPTVLPNNDAQFLESRTFQINEICRWFGCPPHKLADLTRATFSNIEEQERQFVTDTLLPWARRLESEADIKLFGAVQRGRRFTRLNLEALQRGNSQTQTDTVTKKVNAAILTVNEGREYFDLNPIDGGDTPLVQGAMVPLERVLEEPAPEPTQPKPVPTKAEPKPTDPEAIRRVFGGLLTDVYSRLLYVESGKAKRAESNGRLRAWAESFYDAASESHVAAAILPVVEGLAIAVGTKVDAGELAARLAALHNAASLVDPRHEALSNGRAAEQSSAHLELLLREITQ